VVQSVDLQHPISLTSDAGHAPFMQLGQSTNDSVQFPEDAALRKIAEGIKSETGERFFSSLVRHLALVLNCQYAFVSELSKDRLRFRTRAVWGRGQCLENFDVPLAGTPCEAVLNGATAHYPENLCQLFPEDKGLKVWAAQSYCGVPLVDLSDRVVGHLAIIDDKPMLDGPRGIAIMRILAARAYAEIERLRAETAIKEDEERLASILGSAMDAIITFDASRTIELFNHAAEKIFRCSASQSIGRSLDPFLTDAFRNVIDESIRKSDADASGAFVWAPGGLIAKRASGEEFPVEATISQAGVRGRKLYTLILRDVDERGRAEEALRQLSLHNEYLREEIKATHNFGKIVGHSRALAEVLDKVRLVAETDSSVLILGETGTGKELIARAIHSSSPRKGRPLIKVNCSALPTGLIESELFGHEKGAFTGATEKRIGRFELANGGTIFLDEIGEVSAEVQLKLLRVLQEREFERLGGRETIKVDVRVIAATNRDLQRTVLEGTLRQDLYYRLSVFPLQVPPLRERTEDIPLLVHYFVGRHAARIGRRISNIPKAAMERLVAYPWPGNVRELENVIERAVILSPGPHLEVAAEALPAPVERLNDTARGRPTDEARQVQASILAHTDSTLTLEEIDRTHIVEVLQRTGWKIDGADGAARLLKLHPSTLRSRIKKLGIQRSASSIS
jgi:formate hydrogenlyase transcriptional activator